MPVPINGTFSINVVNAVSPYTGLEPGTQYSAESTSFESFDIENMNDWGTSTDAGLNIENLGVVVSLAATGDPGVREIRIESLSAEIPSFAHSAVAPSETGTNHFTLNGNYVSKGTLNVQTGTITNLKIYSLFTNSYFSGASAAHAVLNCSGSLNVGTETLTLTISSAEGYPGA